MKKVNLDREDEKKRVIYSTIILEILGRPPEHLVETLEEIIKKINEEKGVKVINKKVNEPIKIEENKEFYSTFAEVELEVESILYLAMVVFKYMPANVEVISPENIVLTNNGWTEILSELTRRLHGYEELARMIGLENAKMQEKYKEALKKVKEIENKESGSNESKSIGSESNKNKGKKKESVGSKGKKN